MAGHYIKKCKLCDKVIEQCRCPDLNKKVIYEVCKECREKLA